MRKIYLILLLSVSNLLPCLSQSPVPAHTSSFITGLNGRSTEGPSWDDADFIGLVHKMNPAWMRYPAGTQANYWDWRTGTFIEGSGKLPKYKFTIEQCVNGIPPETKLIYVVNMARPTPVTGVALDASYEVLTSESTLRKKAQDILEALAHFKDLGHLPEVVEFGNEFYFDNEHAAIYARNNALYIAHAKILSEIIKTHYPSIDIILCMTKYGTNGRDEWNSAITGALNSDPLFSSRISGVVQHHYLSENYGSQVVIFDDETSELAINEALTYVREQNELNRQFLPSHLKLWLTEYGASKNNASGTWASGIRSVLMSLAWLESSQSVESMLYHHVTAEPDVIQKLSPPVCGPVGVAFGLMMNACKGKYLYEKIEFSDPALYGFRISNALKSGILIVNTSRKSIGKQNLNALLPNISINEQTQYYSTTPYVSGVNEKQGITSSMLQNTSSYTYNPFSVSWISGDVIQTSLRDENTDKQFFVSDRQNKLLKVSASCSSRSDLLVYDISGKNIYQKTIENTGETVDYSSWNRGVYLIILRCGNETLSGKFIY